MSSYNNSRSKTFQDCLGLIWGATLEVWIHQILYVRRVYPLETFTCTEYQGITTCRFCRHPEVVSYIQDTVQAAVPALLRGTATELALHIVERDPLSETIAKEWEVYTLRMLDLNLERVEPKNSSGHAHTASFPSSTDLLRQLERGLRNLILRVQGLPHATSTSHSLDQLSFQITLKIPKEDPGCTQLAGGLRSGTWNETMIFSDYLSQRKPKDGDVEIDDGSVQPNTSRVLRPLHLLDTELCRLDFSMTRNIAMQGSCMISRSNNNDME